MREEEEEVEEERFKVNEKEEEDNTKNTEKRLTDLTILARADHRREDNMQPAETCHKKCLHPINPPHDYISNS